jgi:hypothetical protein
MLKEMKDEAVALEPDKRHDEANSKYEELWYVEENHIEEKIRLRKEAKEIEAKAEAARIADLPPPMTDDDIDKLIANLGFDGNEGKKKNARGTANEGGSKKQGKKGGRGRK